jgi:hypothetical protein
MAKWTHGMTEAEKKEARTTRAVERIRQRRDAGKSVEEIATYARNIAMMWELEPGELGLSDAERIEFDRLNNEAAAREARAQEAALEQAAEKIRTTAEMELDHAAMVHSIVTFAEGLEQEYPRQNIVEALLDAAFELSFEDKFDPPGLGGLCQFAAALGRAGAALAEQNEIARDIIIEELGADRSTMPS